MNRWTVYQWLKRTYMSTGLIPNIKEVQKEFADLDPEEISEGLIEFQLVEPKFKEILDEYEQLKRSFGG